MKISFDFDNCLSRKEVQSYVLEMLNHYDNIELFIVTSRVEFPKPNWLNHKVDNDDVYDIAKQLNIHESNIIFTNYEDKIRWLYGKNFLFHVDDDEYELNEIKNCSDNCECINVLTSNWREDCNRIIESHNKES